MKNNKVTCSECIIGIWTYSDGSDLVTLNDLYENISENLRLYNDESGLFKLLYKKAPCVDDYFDKRKSTNLTWFDYCPACGTKLDIKKLKSDFMKLVNRNKGVI